MDYEYIDGQTPLDEDEKQDLIPTILTRADLDRFEQENIIEARRWVMQKSVLARQDVFTDKFLLGLHKRMFGQVWKWPVHIGGATRISVWTLTKYRPSCTSCLETPGTGSNIKPMKSPNWLSSFIIALSTSICFPMGMAGMRVCVPM